MGDVAEGSLVQQWHDLMALHATVSGELECRLQDEHGIGVSEFEALERLATCDHKCRSADLLAAVHLSQSATSRLVARLEKEGLVTRAMCEQDRRGIFVALTDAGRRRYAEAKQTHRAVLRSTLGEARLPQAG
ncbi:MarR family winged helix-turn-helix transcriptional regulator [Amycolatopsis granulosa]|uniref:MarR family winged helix-turn-helix transcriptional regulator n=1 Tax=Amycolatopsis granulosa TaxID=185684 RepID=UPI0014235B18|nr:MarR family transcriptional regulator [Amycolatopsis granulosa]NIH87733.1 DNA-binding MarR family transcriptional regulator [Amycolatopsis granulosa]